MEVQGILLNLTPNFCHFKNLKAQILEVCPSAQESDNFRFLVKFLEDLYNRPKMASRKK